MSSKTDGDIADRLSARKASPQEDQEQRFKEMEDRLSTMHKDIEKLQLSANMNESQIAALEEALTQGDGWGTPSVGYVTDVEGNYEYWRQYVQDSEVLVRQPDGSISLRDGCELIFGGDAVDKGEGDLDFLAELIALRSRHPGRVHFILGNRDINKMRFTTELHQPHWVPATKHPGYYFAMPKLKKDDALHKAALEAMEEGTAESYEIGGERPSYPMHFLKQKNLEDSMVSRLKWILETSMGSATTFEMRRKWLQRKGIKQDPADEDVFSSFVESVSSKDGENVLPAKYQDLLKEYLKHAKLAHIVGSTLVVHGGMLKDDVGWFPVVSDSWQKENEWPVAWEYEEDVGKWVEKLNAFASQQVEEWLADPHRWEGHRDELGWWGRGFYRRPGGVLMAYGQPKGGFVQGMEVPGHSKSECSSPWASQPTVVYNSWGLVERGAKGAEFDRGVEDYLSKGGIRYVVCGHIPHGDAPLLLPSPDRRVLAVCADTSFAKNTAWEGEQDMEGIRLRGEDEVLQEFPEARGFACHEVLIRLRDGGSIRIRGNLHNKVKVDFRCDSEVSGTQCGDFRVKAHWPNGKRLLSKREGFKVTNRIAAGGTP